MSEPALSVVVATTQPWPEARECLESMHAQADEVGAEIVLAHLGDGFTTAAARRYPLVKPLVVAADSVNEMRGIALGHAGADVVAITEDHCVVNPDWCERILAAHAKHPHAAAIGGAVENGPTTRPIDWAAYFLGNAPAMLPIPEGPADKIAAQANVTYKRWALPDAPPEGGFFELAHNDALRRHGHELRQDPSLVVRHVQSLGFAGTCMIWFHASRTWGGHDGAQRTRLGRLARVVLAPVAHPLAILLHLRTVWAKGRMRGRIVAVSPLMVLLAACATAGLALGYATGKGDSPRHIR